MSKISIVTTTYNRPELLKRTIESVLAQSFEDFEYIIINNGSTDNTQEVIGEYALTDKRIRSVRRAENIKSAEKFYKLRELIITTPEAPYYMQVDDDDFMEPDTIQTLYGLINEYDADIATVGSMWIYPDGTLKDKFVFDGVYVYSRIEAMKELLKREKFNAAAGGKLYRKALLQNVAVPDMKQFRDIHREYRIQNNIRRMVVTGKPMYYFYRHDKNSSGLDTKEQITPERMRQHLEANALRTEWLTEHMPEIAEYVLYCELSFMISLYERINRLRVEPCYAIAEEMKQRLVASAPFLADCGHLTERERTILSSSIFAAR